jgi:putative transposase
VVDVYLQAKRDGAAAKRFFKRLLRSHGGEPRKIVTDKLRSYGVAHRELMPDTIHSTEQYENNRAEQSHEATRVRERGMRKFKSVRQTQRFLDAHAAVSNLFNLGRHLVRAEHYRDLRTCDTINDGDTGVPAPGGDVARRFLVGNHRVNVVPIVCCPSITSLIH